MATIQKRKSRGYTYWYIVESRRVNGKPRPVMLAYLGKAEDLLRRLASQRKALVLRSFSHGDMTALIHIAKELDVVGIINKSGRLRRRLFGLQNIWILTKCIAGAGPETGSFVNTSFTLFLLAR